MKEIQKIKLTVNSTIKEALRVIDAGAMKIALVLDDENYLLGTLTDGDIRRGLWGGFLWMTISNLSFLKIQLYVVSIIPEKKF